MIRSLMNAVKHILKFQLYYELFGSGEFLPNSVYTQLIAEWVCGTTDKGGLRRINEIDILN